MKCKICGSESGKYPLCRMCNLKKEKGLIIKCATCGTWHYREQPCPTPSDSAADNRFIYEAKPALISGSERPFFEAIKSVLPDHYHCFPQINLAAFIERIDDAHFHNELFRNVDFLITDANFQPKIVIEINDRTHLTADRRKRDEKVKKICEEAGIPILKLWTSYGVNTEYIKDKINETLAALPLQRVHHFSKPQNPIPQSLTLPPASQQTTGTRKSGCYIATCVYGSYDCPNVLLLRKYRDNYLCSKKSGRLFIKIYYLVSPLLVKAFGKQMWFKNIFKAYLDRKIRLLQQKGYNLSSYSE